MQTNEKLRPVLTKLKVRKTVRDDLGAESSLKLTTVRKSEINFGTDF
jgi:hypothetical protein